MSRTPAASLTVALLLAACSDAGVTKYNSAPNAQILAPADGDSVVEGEPVLLRGAVGDPNHPMASVGARWTVDGEIVCPGSTPGADGSVSCEVAFAAGGGLIGLEASDPEGAVGSDRVQVQVVATGAPTAALLSPQAGQRYYADRLISFTGEVGDVEDAPEALTVTFETDSAGDLGLTVEVSGEGAVEAFSTLPEGEHAVRLRVVDSSGKSATDSAVITVGPPNSAPSCAWVEPEDGAAGPTGDALRLTAEATDPDVGADELTVTFSSDRDGVLGVTSPDSGGLARLVWSDLTVGTHVLRVEVADEVGETCTASLFYTVGSPPEVEITAPGDGDLVQEGEPVRLEGLVSDAEDPPSALVVRWASDLDGTLATGGPDSSGSTGLSTDALRPGLHTLSLTATDLDGLSASASIVLAVNAPPQVTGVSISPSAPDNDTTVTCSGSATDIDGPTPTFSYTWEDASTGAPLGSGASLDLSATAVASLDLVRCVATATDADGGVDQGSATVMVVNRDPALSLGLSPSSPVRSDTLVCAATAADPDGDAVTTTFSWTVNGVSRTATGSGAGSSSLAGSLAVNDLVVCSATTVDGKGGSAVDVASVTIQNAAPVVGAVTLSPSTARTNDTLSASATSSDPDGDPLTVTTAWTVNGLAAGSGSTLSGLTAFEKGDVVIASVTADDGASATTVSSAPLTIDNTAPGAPGVRISPSSAGPGEALTCVITAASDADAADVLTYIVEWEVDGVPYVAGGSYDTGSPTWVGPSTTTWTDDTVAAADVLTGQEWTCSVTADDGDELGPTASASLGIWETVSFSTCGQTGPTGPSQASCDSAYAGTPLDGDVTVTAGIQAWTVPATGTYRITAAGAAGGRNTDHGNNGGSGALQVGDFSLTAGEVLRVLVGQRGTNGGNNAGGGGGSFVVKQSGNVPLIIAGGGGAGAEDDNNTTNMTLYKHAQAGQCGMPSQKHGGGQNAAVCGGLGGNCDPIDYGQGGGGGFSTNGAGTGSGKAFLNGGAGSSNGGFGGGGHGEGDGGGGGGGYSGGAGGSGGGSPDSCGGGAGSYNVGSSATGTSGANNADGYVEIELL
jgi:hypothetical protein